MAASVLMDLASKMIKIVLRRIAVWDIMSGLLKDVLVPVDIVRLWIDFFYIHIDK